MRRSAQLDQSYRRTLWAGVVISALVHGAIFLATQWTPGSTEQHRLATQRLVPLHHPREPAVDLIALRTEPSTPTTAPPASASTPDPPAPPFAGAATVQAGPEAVAEFDAESVGAPMAAASTATFSPVPAAVLALAGGVTIPALMDLDLEEVPSTGSGVALYQKGSVMSAKDKWVAAAGGDDGSDNGARVVFGMGGGICPVRPNRGIFNMPTG